MANYYFLTSMLPPLEVGHTPGLHFEELNAILQERLSVEDYEQFRVMRRFVDLENLRFFLKSEPLDPRGNLSKEDIEEALSLKFGFPEYVFEFMERYESLSDRLHHFTSLLVQFFSEETPLFEGFLLDYLTFEREWNLVMVAFRAKNLGRDISRELQYEDPSDQIVAQILAQKDAMGFEPPFGYEDLKVIFENKRSDPMAFHKALCEYRFNRIRELEAGELFSLDRILGYVARLMIVERWLEMDQKLGNSIVENMINEAG
ncbi:MAG: hypothetical protein ACI9S8_000131 [Chlamydiales bacterium]|jgi:hypothetical protein